MRRAVLVLAAVAAVAGCGFGGGLDGPTVHFVNRTAVPAVVSVNGGWVGTYPVGAAVEVPIGGHGGPPYRLAVHTPSGALLTEFDITAQDVTSVTSGNGNIGGSATSDCGTIEFSFGAIAGGAGPAVPAANPAALPDAAACP